jgi:hypothetical protein
MEGFCSERAARLANERRQRLTRLDLEFAILDKSLNSLVGSDSSQFPLTFLAMPQKFPLKYS